MQPVLRAHPAVQQALLVSKGLQGLQALLVFQELQARKEASELQAPVG